MAIAKRVGYGKKIIVGVNKNSLCVIDSENNGTWSLPGGWVDVLESVRSNTIKEVK